MNAAVFFSRTSVFSWGQTYDERGGEDERLLGEGKKHTDDTGDYKKTDQGKEKAKAITASFFRNRFTGIRRSQRVCFMLCESMQGN
jgi:hypothetical protein